MDFIWEKNKYKRIILTVKEKNKRDTPILHAKEDGITGADNISEVTTAVKAVANEGLVLLRPPHAQDALMTTIVSRADNKPKPVGGNFTRE